MKLVITGNPGVGKHTAARIISGKIDAQIIDINKVALDENAIEKDTGQGLDVDVKKLTRLLAKMLKPEKNMIVVGHLAPYVVKADGINMVAVLRRSPYELEKTLVKRGYDRHKIRENLASEILGVSLYDAIETFGKRKVVEFDTTGRKPDKTAREIIHSIKRKPKQSGIDWLALISERDDLKKFFDYY